MCGPGGCGHKFSTRVRLVHGEIHECAARTGYIGPHGWITTAGLTLQYIRGGQQLRRMTDSRYRLIGGGEVTHNFDHSRVQPEILRRAAARNHQTVRALWTDVVECRVQREIMAPLLAVGLVAFKIVDGGAHRIAGPL